MCLIGIAFFAMANSVQLPGQQIRYKLIDLGTFGGPSSNLALSDGVFSPGPRIVRRQSIVA